MSDELRAAHAKVIAMVNQLTQARAEVATLRQEHIEALADGKADPKLAGQVKQAQAAVEDLEGAYDLLCQRHRDALRQHLEAEAAAERARIDELAAQESAIAERVLKAQTEFGDAAVAWQEYTNMMSRQQGTIPRQPVAVLEGSLDEVRTRATNDPIVMVDLLQLEASLLELEAEAKIRGFDGERGLPGNRVERVEGKVYLPVAGRVRIEWDHQGQVTTKHLLTVLAVEANNPSAKPMSLPERERIGARPAWAE